MKSIDVGVARIGPCPALRRAVGIAGAWNKAAEGRGGRDKVVDTAAARGDERNAGARGLMRSFWNASFAYGEGEKTTVWMFCPLCRIFQNIFSWIKG